ncbi:actin interacting protein 2 [Hyaloraphidium curvatum]|nr:actin interacting protein 2 [Hyaloraphidium curvatum]
MVPPLRFAARAAFRTAFARAPAAPPAVLAARPSLFRLNVGDRAAARAVSSAPIAKAAATPAARAALATEPAATEAPPAPPKKSKDVMLTPDRFPELNLKRDPKFARLTDADVAYFKSLLGPAGVLTDPEELPRYNVDWMKKYRGSSSLVLRPKTAAEVSQIAKYCNDRKLAIVPQGGNTGLVGGSVPVFDEVVVSLERMNSIRSFDPVSGILVCDAGVVLENADKYLEERGHIFPLDLGAKGSCHVGGNVATNAGGLRLLRYGSLHGSVLGIEAVLADGTVLDNLSTLRKDNTGYDLKQLFIGSEGTLGIITGVSISTPRRPAAVNVCMVCVKSFEDVRRVFSAAKEALGEILSAFEFWDAAATGMVGRYLDHVSNPLVDRVATAPFTVLIETSGSNKSHDDEKLASLLDSLMSSGLVEDGVLSESESQKAQFWHVREGIPVACGMAGGVYKYDVSVPLEVLYELVGDVERRLVEKGLYVPGDEGSGKVSAVVGYGHVGDGNLHLNVSCPAYDAELSAALEPFVYEWVSARGGSISAEHGLGLMKGGMIGYSKPVEMVRLMKGVKGMMDPNGIMNPYKFLPA